MTAVRTRDPRTPDGPMKVWGEGGAGDGGENPAPGVEGQVPAGVVHAADVGVGEPQGGEELEQLVRRPTPSRPAWPRWPARPGRPGGGRRRGRGPGRRAATSRWRSKGAEPATERPGPPPAMPSVLVEPECR